jgi:hypothetical protein
MDSAAGIVDAFWTDLAISTERTAVSDTAAIAAANSLAAAFKMALLPSRPREFHPEPLTGRVEDWRACLGRCLCCLLSRPFVCEGHNISTVLRFQPPPRRTQRADFPHCALLFASPQGLWGLSCWGDFRHAPSNLVAVVQPQRFVQPLRTPPLPAEAVPVLGPRHMAPDLLFHPVFNEAEALAGVSHRKVGHPTSKHRIDQLNDPIQRLRLVAAEYILELSQQRRSFLELGCVYDLPCSGDFSPGRGGLLQLLGMSLPPCCRFHPAEVR